MTPAYQSAPMEVKPVLRVLPNLEIAAIGAELEQSDRLALDAYATRISEYVVEAGCRQTTCRHRRGKTGDRDSRIPLGAKWSRASGQTILVLTTSLTAVKQWRCEILDKTTLGVDEIAEYTGEQKNTGSVTLATYQILTWRENRKSEFPHFELFRARSWGLIIYDEVHLLPAPVSAPPPISLL